MLDFFATNSMECLACDAGCETQVSGGRRVEGLIPWIRVGQIIDCVRGERIGKDGFGNNRLTTTI